MDIGLSNKTIFITGGNSGIGKATALLYAKEANANIAISYHANEAGAHQVVTEIEKAGGNALAVKLDLGDIESIQRAIDTIVTAFGSIHVLVNNAIHWGSRENRGKSFEEMPLSQWQETVGINLFGTVKVTQAVVPYMRKQHFGRIVNVSSDVAFDSMHGSGPYGSLKSALFGLTANLVTELSADNILTNVVIPSWTLTERAKNFFAEEFQQEAVRAFPTKRVTQPEEVASMIVYLGSAINGHVNGECIKVTGKGSQAMLALQFREYSQRLIY